jgi:hypothetical protein
MKSSGTFKTDIKALIMKEDYFAKTVVLASESGIIGDFFVATGNALLDVLIDQLDSGKVAGEDIEIVVGSVCLKHAEIMKQINLALMANLLTFK